ncbi:MAG: GRAM domain-containing protein [Planctomycetales bacterium]
MFQRTVTILLIFLMVIVAGFVRRWLASQPLNPWRGAVGFGAVGGAVAALLGWTQEGWQGALLGTCVGFILGGIVGSVVGLIAMALRTEDWVPKVISMPQFVPGEGEMIVFDGPANLFRGIEGVGGWLWLTDRRLVFRPHAINIQKDPLEIPVEEIVDVETHSTWRLIPNGLIVRTRDDSSHQFVVRRRERWIDAFNDRKCRL